MVSLGETFCILEALTGDDEWMIRILEDSDPSRIDVLLVNKRICLKGKHPSIITGFNKSELTACQTEDELAELVNGRLDQTKKDVLEFAEKRRK